MIRSAVTISLVPQAKGGPFVFWDNLEGSVRTAAELGYDAVEVFAPGPDAVDRPLLRKLLQEHGLSVAAVGTGAGMVIHQLSLIDPDAERRRAAIEFVQGMIRFGADFQAPAIIGSMQGRWTPQTGKQATLERLADALQQLSATAAPLGVPLIYEPLNRYETNLCNTMAEGVQLLRAHGVQNVLLLADLFHMNIEETNVAQGLRDAGKYLGHVHFVDSNRRPAGNGHLDLRAAADALKEMSYKGYASAEAFPWPDSDAAAKQTIETFRRLFPR